MHIIPNILQSDLITVQRQINIARKLPDVEAVQISILDGQFTPERTIMVSDLADLEYGDLQVDVYLLVDEPMDYLWELIELKEWLPIRSVTAHIEHMSFQADFIAEVKKQGWRVGFSLELYTPFESIEADSWSRLDSIQLLATQAGELEQVLNPLVYSRLAEVQPLVEQQLVAQPDRQPLEIWVAGGVSPANIAQVRSQGATVATVSSFWNEAEATEAYRELKDLSEDASGS